MRNHLRGTVFNPIGVDWRSDKVLAVLFHRSAVTLYLIYFLWAVVALIASSPILIVGQSDLVSYLLSLFILPIASLCTIGALYFPRMARLEMYSAGSLASLVVIYEVFVFISAIQGHPTADGFVLNLSHLVIPVVRVVFIYLTLIKQADNSS